MAKFFGQSVKPKTYRIVDDFENKIRKKHNQFRLLGRVFVDIGAEYWSVAMAYNLSMRPGIHGPTNMAETKYCYKPVGSSVSRLELAHSVNEQVVDVDPFQSPDEFVEWAIINEKVSIGHAV